MVGSAATNDILTFLKMEKYWLLVWTIAKLGNLILKNQVCSFPVSLALSPAMPTKALHRLGPLMTSFIINYLREGGRK